MFDRITKNINSAINGLEDEVLRSLKAHEKIVIDYITEIQLFEKGEDGEGFSLGDYTPFTIEIKKSKNQRFDHITLKDTGDFYKSYKLSSKGLITADPQKDDTNLVDEFGADILTLSDEGQDIMIELFLRDDLQAFLRKEIC